MDIKGLATCTQEVAGDGLYLNEIRKKPGNPGRIFPEFRSLHAICGQMQSQEQQ